MGSGDEAARTAMRRPASWLAVAVSVAVPALGCSSSKAPARGSARGEARPGSQDAARAPRRSRLSAEPWHPLPARSVRITARCAPEASKGGDTQEVPALPLPQSLPRSRWPALIELQQLVAAGRQAQARTQAAALLADGGWVPRYAAAMLWSCSPCLEVVKPVLTRVLVASGWRWSSVRWVFLMLEHPDEAVRATALEILGSAATHLGPRRRRARLEFFLPWIRRTVEDPSRWVRASGVALLGLLKDRVAHEIFTRALGDPCPIVRLEAVRAIARAVTLVPGAPTTWAVCARLRDPSPAVRAEVLEVLRSSPRACPLGQVAGLLLDSSRVRLRLMTPESGDLGLRLEAGRVRDHALEALPRPLRAGLPGLPPDIRVKEALRALRSAGVIPGKHPRLRPRPPTTPQRRPGARAGRDRGDEAARLSSGVLAQRSEVSVLRSLLSPAGKGGRASRVALRRRLLSPAARAGMGALLPSLEGAALERALGAVARLPLAGSLLASVVGLLGRSEAEVRLWALEVLHLSTRDDCRRPVLERALWLAREDPDGRVRAAALRLLVAFGAGPSVRQRVAHALGDRDPAVRVTAARALLDICAPWFRALVRGGPEGTLCNRARAELVSRLPEEEPSVRAAVLYYLIRGPGPRPPLPLVVAALGQSQPLESRTRAEASQDPVSYVRARLALPTEAFPSVQAAVVMALEMVFGPRHRGSEAERSLRWQDDLRRFGWDLPRAGGQAPAPSARLPARR